MSGFWQGYANVNDDVRNTYERVFYGRELTDPINRNDMPGLGAQPAEVGASPTDAAATSSTPGGAATPGTTAADLYGPDATHAEREAAAAAWQKAENAPGIRAEIDAANGTPYGWANAPGIQPTNADLYASIYGSGAGGANADTGPAIEAPPIEPPTQTAPASDMTPG